MASAAKQMARHLFSNPSGPGIGRVPPVADGGGAARDDLTVRSVASAGVGALLVLPLLMLASLPFNAPLAVPPLIACGNLAIAFALASGRARMAAAMNAAVLSGLVTWSFLYTLDMPGVASQEGLLTASIAPAFAAAPALARFFIAPKCDSTLGAARAHANCLDKMAISEAVLFVDRHGTLLAATRSARAALSLSPHIFGDDVGRAFHFLDRPKVLQAIARCGAGARQIEFELHGTAAKTGMALGYAVTVDSDGGGLVWMRVRARDCGARTPVGNEDRSDSQAHSARPAMPNNCEVGEALAFTLRHTRAKLEEREIAFEADVEALIEVRSDRQMLRRIAHRLIDCAATATPVGGKVRVSARRLKGAALLRVSSFDATGDGGARVLSAGRELMNVRALVEQAGGTIVEDCSGGTLSLSVRLDLAAA